MKNLFRLFMAFVLFSFIALGQNTQLTGTMSTPSGTGLNGFIYLQLPQVAASVSSTYCANGVASQIVPNVPVVITVKNGVLTNAPKVWGSDCLIPNLAYNVTVRDSNGNQLYTDQWFITGSVQNVGNVIPSGGTSYSNTLFVLKGGDTMTGGLTAPSVNGVFNTAVYTGSTATQVSNTITALPLVTATDGTNAHIGPMIIPPTAAAYSGPGDGTGSNPMLTSGQQGGMCWDYRAPMSTGWPGGGLLVSDCDDWISANHFYFPGKTVQFGVGEYFHANNAPANYIGMTALTAFLAVDGTPSGSTIQANDTGADELYAMPGYNSSSTRTYTNAREENWALIGALTGTSPGAHIDVYDARGLTANFVSQNAPSTDNATIANWADIAAQPVTYIPTASSHFGTIRSVWAQSPGMAENSLYLTGTATFTNGSGTFTRVSGDYINDEAMINEPMFVNGVPYTMTSSPNSGTGVIYPLFAGASGTYTWKVAGSSYSIDAESVRFDTTNPGTPITPMDPRGGGGIIFDPAGTSCLGFNPIPCQIWIRQPGLAAVQADGTFPRMGISPDQYGSLIFYTPCTVSFTGSISGTTLTVTTPTSGGSNCGNAVGQGLMVGQTITPPNVSYGDKSYGVITALGTGTGGAGTYTLSQSSTLGSTSLVGLGEYINSSIIHDGSLQLKNSEQLYGYGATTGTGYSATLQSLPFGGNPSTIYSAFTTAGSNFDAIAGATVAQSSGTSQYQMNGVAGYIQCGNTTTNCVANAGYALNVAGGGKAWGANFAVIDQVGLPWSYAKGLEVDTQPQNPAGSYGCALGLDYCTIGIQSSLYTPGTVAQGTNFWSNRGQTGQWITSFFSDDGAATLGLRLGAASATSYPSQGQPIRMDYLDSSNSRHTSFIYGDPTNTSITLALDGRDKFFQPYGNFQLNSGYVEAAYFFGPILGATGAPTGSCSPNGLVDLAQDGTYSICRSGTWVNTTIVGLGTSSGGAIPASLTTTSSTSDNVTVTGMTSSGHCSIGPTNATASLSGVYISAKTTNQITVTHPATSGMAFDFLCTSN